MKGKPTPKKGPRRGLPTRREQQNIANNLVASTPARATLKRLERESVIEKPSKDGSPTKALYKASSLAPTRVVLPIAYTQFLSLLSYFAKLTAYAIQSTGDMPRFNSTTTDAEPGWNPSMILAYYIAIYAGRLAKLGALPASTNFLIMSEYLVPTFIGKHLQQISTSSHMGREVTCLMKESLQNLLATDCGTGGLPVLGAELSAPCYVDGNGDTEGWFSVIGPVGEPTITPDSLTSNQLNKLSAVIARTFKNHVKVSDIPEKASNNELKITPVSSESNGQLIYSCLDDKTMCDLILPLGAMNTNSLLNSPNPLQAAAPIRCDGSLVMCPEAKISFMFWLANKHPFQKSDSFIYYLRKFGVKDQHLGNLQLNLRQINWTSFNSLVGIYCATLSGLDAKGYWYLYNYLASVVWANIPGPFRAFTPIAQNWSLSKQFKNICQNPGYAVFAKNPKIPPFVANVIHMLRTPIRSANQITMFFGQASEDGAVPFWEQVATNANGSYAGSYGNEPVTIQHSDLGWNQGPYQPYPGFQAVAPPGITDGQRNAFCLRNLGPDGGFLQQFLTTNVTNQNLFNQWNSEGVKFMKRSGRYYIPGNVGPAINYPTGSTNGFQYKSVIPRLIASWEPCGYVTALLSLANQLTYYMPSEPSLPLNPTFSALPSIGVEDTASAVMSAANPGQGTQQAIAIGKATNPAEAQAHISAQAAEGAIPDQSTPVPEHLHDKVAAKVIDNVKGLAEDLGPAVKDGAVKVAKGTGKTIVKAVGAII